MAEASVTADQLKEAGDQGLAALFRQHHAGLVRLAVLVVQDQPTAEDVVQDVFARMYANTAWSGRPGEEMAYIRAAVLNGCRSVLRRRAVTGRARRWREITDEAAPVPSAETEVIRAEGRREVLVALARLSARRREVLVLRYFVGLSEAEIAQALGISAGTVKSAAARGIAALARALGEEP
jgi:RNA polymerase sigma-70 factor (sigma-E family)